MKAFINLIQIIKRFTKDEMPVFAASATFWMLISVVPFLMVIMTAIQFIPGLDKATVENTLISAAPDMPQFRELIMSVTDNLYISAPSAVLSITAFMAVWSASAGVYAIENGLMKIYGTQYRDSYPKKRLRAVGFTFLFLLVFLITLLLLVLGTALQHLIESYLPMIAVLTSHILGMRVLIAVCLLFAAFILVYTVMPGGTGDLRRHCPGALFASLGWIIFSYLFSIYFTYFRNLSYMYGSLCAIVLLMFWMFSVICILFFGAELNEYFAGEKKGTSHQGSSHQIS